MPCVLRRRALLSSSSLACFVAIASSCSSPQASCGSGTTLVENLCVVDPADGGQACGPGTFERDGLCLPLPADAGSTTLCGANTQLINNVCIAIAVDGGVTCGPGTQSVNGLCIPLAVDPPITCGMGTVAVGTQCLPVPTDGGLVTCGTGTVLLNGQCVANSDGGSLTCGNGTVLSAGQCVVASINSCHVSRKLVRPLKPFVTGASANVCSLTTLPDRIVGWLQTASTIETVVAFPDGGVLLPQQVSGVSTCPGQTISSAGSLAGAFALPDGGTLVIVLDAQANELGRHALAVSSSDLASGIGQTKLVAFRGAFALGKPGSLIPITAQAVGAPLVASADPASTRLNSLPLRHQLYVENYRADGGVDLHIVDEQSLATLRTELLHDFQFASVELFPSPDVLGVGQWATSGLPYLRSIPVGTTGVLPGFVGVGVPVSQPRRMTFTGRFWLFGCCGATLTAYDAAGRVQLAQREPETLSPTQADAGIARCTSTFQLKTGDESTADLLANCDDGQLGTALRSGPVWARFGCD